MITQERWRLVKKEGEAGKISLIEKMELSACGGGGKYVRVRGAVFVKSSGGAA